MRSLVSGESLASVTSSGSRGGRTGTSVADGRAAGGCERVAEVWRLARDRRRDGDLVVAPGAGLTGRRRDRHRLAIGAATCLPWRVAPAAAAAAASSSSAGVRRIEAAAVVPIQRAVPTAGLVSCRSGIPKPTTTPKIARATSRTNAPGAENRSVRAPARARPTRPPEIAEDLGCSGDPDVGDRQAQQGDPPARVRAGSRTPFEPPAGEQQHERRQPAHRPEPRPEDAGPPAGQRALARAAQRDERHRPEHEQRQADDRADDIGGQPPAQGALGPRPRRAGGRCLPGGRPPARGHVRPRRRRGRPSAGASSARTGSARRRP